MTIPARVRQQLDAVTRMAALGYDRPWRCAVAGLLIDLASDAYGDVGTVVEVRRLPSGETLEAKGDALQEPGRQPWRDPEDSESWWGPEERCVGDLAVVMGSDQSEGPHAWGDLLAELVLRLGGGDAPPGHEEFVGSDAWNRLDRESKSVNDEVEVLRADVSELLSDVLWHQAGARSLRGSLVSIIGGDHDRSAAQLREATRTWCFAYSSPPGRAEPGLRKAVKRVEAELREHEGSRVPASYAAGLVSEALRASEGGAPPEPGNAITETPISITTSFEPTVPDAPGWWFRMSGLKQDHATPVEVYWLRVNPNAELVFDTEDGQEMARHSRWGGRCTPEPSRAALIDAAVRCRSMVHGVEPTVELDDLELPDLLEALAAEIAKALLGIEDDESTDHITLDSLVGECTPEAEHAGRLDGVERDRDSATEGFARSRAELTGLRKRVKGVLAAQVDLRAGLETASPANASFTHGVVTGSAGTLDDSIADLTAALEAES